MAYNIKLFVHGVPNGQDIWGTPGADVKYIEAFYGRKSNVASQMILEVMQFGGETNAYYTYFYYNDKIQDKQNRIGGYFALTLRINYYYTDIQNIYNLLEAAFNKYVIGSVLEYTAGCGCRFIVSQFNQASDNFTALEKEIEHYLMQFSNNNDFVSLSGFKSNGQNECGTINLLESAPSLVLSHVKSTGKISVSSLHPTSKEQQIVNKMKSEVQAAQKDKEQGILAVKNEYKDADKTISKLRAQIDKDKKEISNLNTQITELNNDLQTAKDYKTKYEKSKRKLEKTENLIADIKNSLSGLNGISELLGVSVDAKKRKSPNTFGSFVKKIHPFVDFFVMIILIGIIGVSLPKGCINQDNNSIGLSDHSDEQNEVEELTDNGKENKQNDGNEVSENKDKPESSHNELDEIKETLKSLRTKYPNAKIDVSNINEETGVFMQVRSRRNYNVKIVGVDKDLKGEWGYDPEDFYVHDGNLIPKRAGKCKIVYKVNGINFLERIITVKQ